MTNRQKQCLLAYLGFYNGKANGIWNEESKDATLKFQKAYGDIEPDDSCGEKTQMALMYAVTYGV